MQVTKDWRQCRVDYLNEKQRRPVTLYDPATTNQQNISHLCLDKDAGGYKLVEIIGYARQQMKSSNN